MSKERNMSLNIVRCMAAYMILFCHIGQYNHFTITGEMRKGVQLFFIMSGFLIFGSIESTHSTKKFYLKRIARIVPIYWITLLINYLTQLLWCIFVDGNTLSETILDGPCGIRYLRYFTFLHMVIPSDNYGYWNNAYAVWTMSSFFVFYVIAPLMFRWINSFIKSVIVMLAALGIRPITIRVVYRLCLYFLPEKEEVQWFANNTPLNTLYCFCVGIAIYWATKESKQTLLGMLLVLIFIMGKTNWFAYEMILGVFVLITVSCPIKLNILSKYINLMAESSFSLYLIHPACLKMVNYGLNMLGLSEGVLCCTVLTIFAISAGILYWYFVERPASRWTKNLLEKWGRL